MSEGDPKMPDKSVRELAKKYFPCPHHPAQNCNCEKKYSQFAQSLRQIVEGELEKENPFPENIFVPPTKEQYAELHKALLKVGLTLDKFSGDIGRTVWKNIIDTMKANLERVWG